jgi:hypothetical protein
VIEINNDQHQMPQEPNSSNQDEGRKGSVASTITQTSTIKIGIGVLILIDYAASKLNHNMQIQKRCEK